MSQEYDRELVFHTWLNFVKREIRPIPPDLQWYKEMTLAGALKSLETYFKSIGDKIKKREEK